MDPRRFTWRDSNGEHLLEFVWVPGTTGVSYRFGYGPQVRSMDLQGFFICTTQVTQDLWQRVMGNNPARRKQPRCPVENISWDQITEPGGFLDRLNASDVLAAVAAGDSSLRFRLPSEAEWEYAARGGAHWQDGFNFSGSNEPDDVAWYGRRWNLADQIVFSVLGWPLGWRVPNRIRKMIPRHTQTHPVGEKAANQLGIFDMSGNVWEWCQDICTDDLNAVPADGSAYGGPGTERRLRGGCHNNWDLHCRVWWRYGIQPDAHDGDLGFRIVLSS